MFELAMHGAKPLLIIAIMQVWIQISGHLAADQDGFDQVLQSFTISNRGSGSGSPVPMQFLTEGSQ